MADPATSVAAATPGAAWSTIYDRLAAGDPDVLTAEELVSLADAAFWLGKPREMIAARERAYAKTRAAGDETQATMLAWLLYENHFDLDETAAASGWLRRAERHAGSLGDHVAVGYVALAGAEWALFNGDVDAATERAEQASAIARRFADHELDALTLATQGRILIAVGDMRAGQARFDEAMVATIGDELSPLIKGWVYCLLLDACHETGDVRRAAEWTDLAIRWAERRGLDSWYPGLCRLHECEVRSLRGDWPTAEREALKAAAELAPFGEYLLASGEYLAGEIRLRTGDYAGAEETFSRAHEHGHDTQPGSALLQAARGDVDGASAALRVALAAPSGPHRRARLLAASVEIELRRGDVAAATKAATELAELAAAGDAPLLRAIAETARGAVLVAAGEPEAAVPLLRAACEACRELSCPYEGGLAQVQLGLAARRMGDDDTARRELTTARATFERLGARPDTARVTQLLDPGRAAPTGLTDRELEVLRLVAHGQSNRQIAGELFISEHTVARHLSNIFAKLGIASRSAATSYAYEHRLT